jgi:hypothetical protein
MAVVTRRRACGGRGHKRGTPSPADPPPNVLDQQAARQLWAASVGLTGVDFSALAADDAGITIPSPIADAT